MSYLSDLLAELGTLQHFQLLRPYWLLMIIPVYFILNTFSSRDDTLSVWRKLMSTEMVERLTVKGNSSTFFSPLSVSWLLVFLVCVVLSGPSWQQKSSPFAQDDSVLVIAIDVSQTMLQSDIQPSRLLRAKQKVVELLSIRGDANTALIAFSGSAHIVMPVTNDAEMIKHFLDSLAPNVMPRSGKSPDQILPLVEELLSASKIPGTLLFVGDGITQESSVPFSRFFDVHPHQLIVWAIGDINKSSFVEKGSTLIPLQQEQLTALANTTSGSIVNISHDKQDVDRILRYINNHLTIIDDESRPWHDAGYPLVFIISLLFLFWFRKGWTLQW